METVNKKSKILNSPILKGELVKGFKDKVGAAAKKAAFIREVAKQTFEKYNYEEAETPIIEYEKFVKGSTDAGDDAISEVFTLKDKGKRNLALRYEFTFQLKRIAKNQKLPFKRFQIGPVFRDEPISANRVRQFTQCDVDIVGAKIKDEAELLAVTSDILKALKINATIYVNNKKLLNEILTKEGIKKNQIKIIRTLDKLDKLPEKEVKKELKKLKAEKLLEIVKQPETFFKQYEAYKEIEELKTYAKLYGVNIIFAPTLARGLSYYIGNVFEIKSQIKETICAGGTYMVGDNIASGISFSIERLMAVTNILINIDKILVASINEDEKAMQIAKQLRKQGKNASVFFGKPAKAFDYAKAYGIKKILFVGKKETETKKFKLRNIDTGKEVTVTIEKQKRIKL